MINEWKPENYSSIQIVFFKCQVNNLKQKSPKTVPSFASCPFYLSLLQNKTKPMISGAV